MSDVPVISRLPSSAWRRSIVRSSRRRSADCHQTSIVECLNCSPLLRYRIAERAGLDVDLDAATIFLYFTNAHGICEAPPCWEGTKDENFPLTDSDSS